MNINHIKIHWIPLMITLLWNVDALAQDNLFKRIDRILENRYYNVKVDTNYLKRPDLRWTAKLSTKVSTSGVNIVSKTYGNECTLDMRSNFKTTASLSVAYSGLSLSFSANPAKLSGKQYDWGINLISYGNTIGADIMALSAKTMTGNMNLNGIDCKLGTDAIQQNSIYLNGYYAFNHHKFSYPAAFTQSYIQKRSAGSWLLTTSLYGNIIDSEIHSNIGRFYNINVTLGGGYGYNWVPSKRWLLHISCTPNFIVYSYSQLKLNEESISTKMQFPEVHIASRGAVLYNMNRYFLGISMLFNYSGNGHTDVLRISNTKYFWNTFIGMRF